MSEVKIKIEGDSKGFEQAAKEAAQLFKNFIDGMVKRAKTADLAWASFIGNLGAQAVTKGLSLLKDGFNSAINLGRESIKLSEIQEKAVNDLNLSLANTGKFSRTASKDFQAFASELQNASMIGDEVILKNAAMIQSMGALSTDGLKRATQAAADFAAGTGKSFEEASRMIGKASTGQVQALAKFGIMVENTGDKTRDFDTALKLIEDRFSGSALSSTKTFEGATTQLANSMGDVQEVIGDIITKNPTVVKGIGLLKDGFEEFGRIVDQNKAQISRVISEGFNLLIQVAGSAAKSVIGLGEAIYNTFGDTELNQAKDQLKKTQLELMNLQEEWARSGDKNLENEINLVREQIKLREEEVEAARVAQESKKGFFESFKDTITETQESIAQATEEFNLNEIEAEREKQLEKRNLLVTAAEQNNADKLEYERLLGEGIIAQAESTMGRVYAMQLDMDVKKLKEQNKYQQASLKLLKAKEDSEKNSIFTVRKYEDLTQKEKLDNLRATFGAIASLQSSSSKELFLIGKAAAIGAATIDGYLAVQKALGAAPPPLSFALAALVGTATALNVAKIAAQKPPTGAFDGALVEGGSAFRDSQPFMLSKGELVAPRRSFDEVVEGVAMKRGFSKQDSPQESSINISIQGDVIGDELFINNLVEKIRDAVQFRNAVLGG